MAKTNKGSHAIRMAELVAAADFFIDNGMANSYEGRLALEAVLFALYEEGEHQAKELGMLDQFNDAFNAKLTGMRKEHPVC